MLLFHAFESNLIFGSSDTLRLMMDLFNRCMYNIIAETQK